MQERGKRRNPLIFPANSPKNSRNGIGCIQRNPTKGIESIKGYEDILSYLSEVLVAFNEIPQRELRGKRPGTYDDLAYALGCIQRNPTKGIERLNQKW